MAMITHSSTTTSRITHTWVFDNVVLTSDVLDNWDNGAEGNYWDDLKMQIPTAQDADKDGIWDFARYQVDHFDNNIRNYDNYPLVNPWKSFRQFTVAPGNSSSRNMQYTDQVKLSMYDITIRSDHVVASLNLTKSGNTIYPTVISFNITAGASGFCNVTILRALLDGPFSLMVNNALPQSYSIRTLNENYTSVYFTYIAGKYQVRIVGTRAGTVLGDINGDGKIDLKDVFYVELRFGWKLPSPLTSKDIIEDNP
jgi:hypothetical protein